MQTYIHTFAHTYKQHNLRNMFSLYKQFNKSQSNCSKLFSFCWQLKDFDIEWKGFYATSVRGTIFSSLSTGQGVPLLVQCFLFIINFFLRNKIVELKIENQNMLGEILEMGNKTSTIFLKKNMKGELCSFISKSIHRSSL